MPALTAERPPATARHLRTADRPDDVGRRGLDRRARREHRQRLTPAKVVRRTVAVLVVAATVLWAATTFLVQGFAIPSGSMSDTLQVGDRVLVSKLVPDVIDVRRGDIVVFTDPGGWLEGVDGESGRQHVVKRAVGLPGDRVEHGDDASGRITVNGVPLDETYLRPGIAPSEVEFDVVVPEGHLFVLGDNRPHSADSRSHLDASGGGFVPLYDVVGVAVTVYWPLGNASSLQNSAQVFDDVSSPSQTKTPNDAP